MVFKLCAAALWGAAKNPKGAGFFFREYEIFKSFYRNLADFSIYQKLANIQHKFLKSFTF